MDTVQAKPRRRPSVRITDRDRLLLAFAAENRIVLAGQLGALLGITTDAATRRLRALTTAGYLRAEQKLHGEPSCYQVTRKGIGAIGSDLPRPQPLDLANYRHDIGVGWLMVAARTGLFGAWREITSERHMRSHDPRPDRQGEPFGVRLGGLGADGRPRLHYPDLSMITHTGHRVVFELELTSKPRRRREQILSAYAADRRIAQVVYLVDKPATGRTLRTSVRQLGIGHRVRVQDVEWGSDPARSAPARAAERAPRDRARAAAGAGARER